MIERVRTADSGLPRLMQPRPNLYIFTRKHATVLEEFHSFWFGKGDLGLLNDLFRLDGTPIILDNGEMPQMSPGDTVANIVFPQDDWSPANSRIKGVTFNNVSFSKTKISKITFTDCNFEDCLFIGAQLEEVEFHGCNLVNCNLWKVRLKHVYLRPDHVNFDRRFHVDAANVGISIFQEMLSNFSEEHQDKFYMEADIKFRRWKRYQIWHDLKMKRKTKWESYWGWISSIIHEHLTGFGYRPLRYFIWTLFIFFSISFMNHLFIGDQIQFSGSEKNTHASLVDSIFYSFSVLTVLGFSSVIPLSDVAKILTVLEALTSIGWLGIFTAILVKRFLR